MSSKRQWDNREYTFFCIFRDINGDLRIESGWEYRSDAHDRQLEMNGEKKMPWGAGRAMVRSRALCISMGVNPRDNASWEAV